MHKSTWLFIPHQTPSQGGLHYIPHTAARPSWLDAPKTCERKSYLNWNWHKHTLTLCLWFWGQIELGWARYLSLLYLLVELFYACFNLSFFLPPFCPSFLLSLVSRVVVWEEWYICIIFRGEENSVSYFLTDKCRFVGLITGFKVTEVEMNKKETTTLTLNLICDLHYRS